MIRKFYVLCVLTALCGCASTQVTQELEVPESADAPYGNVLVISLFKSFDARRYFEQEVVSELEKKGIRAVASTSLMDTKTPLTRQTFRDMAASLDSDAVLVTRLVSLDTQAELKDARPESTYNIRPTYYYNVWSVELTEYVEPPNLEMKHDIALATQLYSVARQEPVWAIQSQTKVAIDFERRGDGSIIEKEAKVITSRLSKQGLLSP